MINFSFNLFIYSTLENSFNKFIKFKQMEKLEIDQLVKLPPNVKPESYDLIIIPDIPSLQFKALLTMKIKIDNSSENVKVYVHMIDI